jgi:predicted DNA-binding transcriptional regulator AlpA
MKSGKPKNKRSRWKPVVTVQEMAAMVGLSRSRFYALVADGVFPGPVYEMLEYRAVYPDPIQCLCLQIRRDGKGLNGKVVRFRGRW